ncbi:zinc finger (CCCH-type/C3HC4-type RING finger) family protein [Carex rostrata]
MADSGEPSEVCTFFRKPTANKNIRKRKTQSTSDEEQDDNTSSLLSKKKVTAPADNKLRFSSSTNRASNKPESDAAEGEEESDVVFKFESSSSIQVENDNRATAVLETETEFDRDARAIRERVLKQAAASLKEGGKLQGGEEEKLYKGIHGYKDYKAGFRREHTVASEKAGGAHGPLRTSAHIRVSARFDYQPDICKDYKETGYCGYGDSCKFMHDRGDYKSGWQLERDWDESEKERKRNLAMGHGGDDDGHVHVHGDDDDDDDDDDELPFACYICREPFVDPVATKCKHYFCEHCALKHHSKNKKCFVCNKPTLGIFNVALEIKKRMAQEK